MRERFNVVLSLNTREQSQVVNLSMEIEKGSLLRKEEYLEGETRSGNREKERGRGKRKTEREHKGGRPNYSSLSTSSPFPRKKTRIPVFLWYLTSYICRADPSEMSSWLAK